VCYYNSTNTMLRCGYR